MEDKLTIRSAGALEVELEIAGIGSRSYAFIIDWHIRLLLALAWLVGTALVFAGSLSSKALGAAFGGAGSAAGYVVTVPALAIYFLYHPVLEVLMQGRTPGKRMAGLRIVTTAGATPGLGALLIRNVFRIVDSAPVFYALGLAVAAMTARQVRIGDLAAGTVLVYDPRSSKHGLASAALSDAAAGLHPRQIEWLEDLVERWADLRPDARRRLAAEFLRSNQMPLPAGEGRQYDRALREQLARLLGADVAGARPASR
jgi:uncharacterized RDD family membrane protein YckC